MVGFVVFYFALALCRPNSFHKTGVPPVSVRVNISIPTKAGMSGSLKCSGKSRLFVKNANPRAAATQIAPMRLMLLRPKLSQQNKEMQIKLVSIATSLA